MGVEGEQMIRTDVRDIEQDRSVPGVLGEARKQGVQALGSAGPETALARIAASRICGAGSSSLRRGACHRNLSSSGPGGPRRPGYPCYVSMSSVFASVSLPPSVPFLYIYVRAHVCVCVHVCVISEENL